MRDDNRKKWFIGCAITVRPIIIPDAEFSLSEQSGAISALSEAVKEYVACRVKVVFKGAKSFKSEYL